MVEGGCRDRCKSDITAIRNKKQAGMYEGLQQQIEWVKRESGADPRRKGGKGNRMASHDKKGGLQKDTVIRNEK